MKATLQPFKYEQDFIQVRDFLSKTFQHYQRSVNWRIERWEYAFHFVAPFLGNWDEQPPLEESAQKAHRFLESLTGIWKTDIGEVAGVVNIEHPDLTHSAFGEFFIQRHPDYLNLFPSMLDFAEGHLIDPGQNRLFIFVEQNDFLLQELLIQRGFTSFENQTETESQLILERMSLPETPALPEGFVIQSMADDNDLAKRCKAFGTAFNHPDPAEWPSIISYQKLQQAPDYKKDQDIVVVTPNGEFASFCLIWFDRANKLAILEPVGTQPEYRRLGLAREAIYEAIRRVATKGAQKVIVGSDQPFYLEIGFAPTETRMLFKKVFHSSPNNNQLKSKSDH